MKRIRKLTINIVVIISILFSYYYFYGYYFSKDQCILETRRSLYINDDQKIDEIVKDDCYYTLFADLEKKSFSVVGTKRIGFLYHTISGDMIDQTINQDTNIHVVGSYSSDYGMNIVVYKNNKNVDRVEIVFEDGQDITIDDWENDFAFINVHCYSYLDGLYRSYDKNDFVIDAVEY